MKINKKWIPGLFIVILIIPIVALLLVFIVFKRSSNFLIPPISRSNPMITTCQLYSDDLKREPINNNNFIRPSYIENLSNYKTKIIENGFALNGFDEQFMSNCFDEINKQASLPIQNRFDAIYNYNQDWDQSQVNSEFDNLKNDFENTILTVNWNQIPGIKSNLKDLRPFIDWDDIIEKFTPNYDKTDNNIKKDLLKFYNFMFRTYGKTNVLRYLVTLESLKLSSSRIAGIAAYFATNLGPSALFYNSDSTILNPVEQYQNGIWSSNHPLSVIIHEYAHSLDYFFRSPKFLRKDFNNLGLLQKEYPKLFDSILKQITNSNTKENYFKNTKWINNAIQSYKHFNYKNSENTFKQLTPSQMLKEFLAKRLKITDEKRKTLLMWSIVPSYYGRFNGLHETFAEAFSYLIGTPATIRGQNWELLAEFFLDYLPLL